MADPKEKKRLPGDEAQAAAPPTLWFKLNDWAQKNTKLVVFLCSVLVVIIVAVLANYFYQKQRYERGFAEIEQAQTVEKLKDLKDKYSDMPDLHALALYRLGNRHFEEEHLTEAKAAYEELKRWHPDHDLAKLASRALSTLKADEEFLDKEKEGLIRQYTLYAHPMLRDQKKSLMPRYGPNPQPNPRISIVLPKGAVKVELFEDEAPIAVTNFIELAGNKYFNGLKFTKIGDERVQIADKTQDPVKYRIPFERTYRELEPGVLVMVRNGNEPNNLGASFQILLKAPADPKPEITVIGMVDTGLEFFTQIGENDAVQSMPVERKRDHEYKSKPEHRIEPK